MTTSEASFADFSLPVFMIKAESKQCEELFMAMDDNNDGTLSVAELKEGLTKARCCENGSFKALPVVSCRAWGWSSLIH